MTPIEKTRLPIGIFRWKTQKEGYEAALTAASIWDIDTDAHNLFGPNNLLRVLDKEESIPPDMVRVTG
ncbi:MAG: hypothetical protein HXY20_11290 [Acidobacteria bacterium]|nr:hypothetical protein [Acidobacteriota bacterium]